MYRSVIPRNLGITVTVQIMKLTITARGKPRKSLAFLPSDDYRRIDSHATCVGQRYIRPSKVFISDLMFRTKQKQLKAIGLNNEVVASKTSDVNNSDSPVVSAQPSGSEERKPQRHYTKLLVHRLSTSP